MKPIKKNDIINKHDSSDDEDILVPVKKERIIEDTIIKPKETLKLNSKTLKRITTDGPFGGKNREILDGEGRPMD